jgi:2'-5' RNA ligase
MALRKLGRRLASAVLPGRVAPGAIPGVEIGYAIAVNHDVHNLVRRLQLQIFQACGPEARLEELPHITLKQGFLAQDLEPFERHFDALARSIGPFEIRVQGIGTFESGGVLCLGVEPSPQLAALRERTLRELSNDFGVQANAIEDHRYRFHVTVAHSLTPRDLRRAFGAVGNVPVDFRFRCDGVQMLCNFASRWMCYKQFPTRLGPGLVEANGRPIAAAENPPLPVERMRFARQFLLCPEHVEAFPSWERVDLGRHRTLRVHPDLGVLRVTDAGKTLTSLGYLIDSENPQATNAEILRGLLERFEGLDDLFRSTDRLGGRWILIADDGRRSVLFSDAAGMRQAFYARGSAAGELWCASQPTTIAQRLELRPDDEALAFMQTEGHAKSKNLSAWFPGDTTPYAEVRHLLPNHYLDLDTGETHRYWPRAHLEPLDLEQGVEESMRILRGLVDGVRRRYEITMAMTAGWDCRLALALARPFADDVFFFTGLFGGLDPDDLDAASPTRLLTSLGLKNNLVRCNDGVDECFRRVFVENVMAAREDYAALTYGMHRHCPGERICMKGDVAEIVKCYWRLEKPDSDVTAHDLAKLAEMDPHPFVIGAFERWLSGARAYNVPLLDLFCWEQAMGRQEAAAEAECDIVQDAFTPFNCRELLTVMLRVEEKHRYVPTFWLFRKLIARAWPEVLEEPINGVPQIGARATIRTTLMRAGAQRLLPKSIKQFGRRILG